MKKFLFILIALIVVFNTNLFANKKKATNKRKTTKKTKVVKMAIAKDSVNQSLMLCYASYGMPAWYLELKYDFKFPENIQKPSDYRLVQINDTMLNAYLKTIPFDTFSKKINIPIYTNKSIVCKEFQISRVLTMDKELQDKYPDLMTFQAVEKNNALNTARIECDGKSMNILVNYNGETLFVTPYLYNKKTYYACYGKNDPNFIKHTFE